MFVRVCRKRFTLISRRGHFAGCSFLPRNLQGMWHHRSLGVDVVHNKMGLITTRQDLQHVTIHAGDYPKAPCVRSVWRCSDACWWLTSGSVHSCSGPLQSTMRTFSLQSAFTVDARTSTSGASDGRSHVSARPYDNGNCSTMSVCHSCSCNMTSIILAIRGFAGGVRLKCWHVQVLDVTPEPVQNTGRLMQLIASLHSDCRLPQRRRLIVSAGTRLLISQRTNGSNNVEAVLTRNGTASSVSEILTYRAEMSRWRSNILSSARHVNVSTAAVLSAYDGRGNKKGPRWFSWDLYRTFVPQCIQASAVGSSSCKVRTCRS